jgi:methylenetetrahydrofolate dehydrogenase (NAD+)
MLANFFILCSQLLPVFGSELSFNGGSMDDYLRDSISPEKDVEGLCHTYRNNLYRNIRFMDMQENKKCILPCTPLAVVKILESEGMFDTSLPEGSRLQGKCITVVNRSEVVGRPLAALLANDGATVFSIDIDSTFKVTRGSRCVKCSLSTEDACRLSQVVVLGVPSKDYSLTATCIQPGTLVVNVSTFKNIDATELSRIEGTRLCSAVGKVTVAMLER